VEQPRPPAIIAGLLPALVYLALAILYVIVRGWPV